MENLAGILVKSDNSLIRQSVYQRHVRKSVLISALIGVSTLLAISVVSYNMSFSQLTKGTIHHESVTNICWGGTGVINQYGDHWNKVVFKIVGDPSGKIPKQHMNTLLEIVYLIDPSTIVNVKEMVKYTMTTSTTSSYIPIVPSTQAFALLTSDEIQNLDIKIVDIEYAVICNPVASGGAIGSGGPIHSPSIPPSIGK